LQLDELWAWIYCKDKNRTQKIAAKHPRCWRCVALGCSRCRYQACPFVDVGGPFSEDGDGICI
jgi:hypothetical protein